MQKVFLALFNNNTVTITNITHYYNAQQQLATATSIQAQLNAQLCVAEWDDLLNNIRAQANSTTACFVYATTQRVITLNALKQLAATNTQTALSFFTKHATNVL
jgi:hypothetical protein